MFFKKKKIKPQTSKYYKTPLVIWFLWVLWIIYLWILAVGAASSMSFNVFDFETKNWSISALPGVSIFSTPEKEDFENTYILLTGRWWGTHDAPNLTDTIILAWINAKDQKISLLSLPRDLWVEYPWSSRKWKINALYETYLANGWDTAMERLSDKVSEITGKQIDYYMNVDFAWFIKVIDALWWVEVSLENNFVDYEYPDGNLWYKTFILRKWTWTLDGEVALMYARSRHSTSDFDRSSRQQEILGSLKDKVWDLWYLKDAKKILELYNIFSEYVDTDLKLQDMVRIWLEIKSWESSDMIRFNLNDSCFAGSPDCIAGWLLYVPLREYFSWASVLLPNTALAATPSNYDEIQRFSDMIFETPNIYSPEKQIVIYNASRIPRHAWDLADILRPYGFSIDNITGTQTLREKKFEKSILYYNGISEDSDILKEIQNFIEIPMEMTDSPLYSSSWTTIEIVLSGEDSF